MVNSKMRVFLLVMSLCTVAAFCQDGGSAANTSAGYENFTIGQRVGTWAINSAVPGIGSFVIMKDYLGGGIQLGAGILGYVLIGAGIADIVKGSTNERTYNDAYHKWEGEGPDEDAIRRGTTATVIGGILLVGNGVFNIVRSAMYNKPAPAAAGGFDPARLQVALLPGNKLSLSYTVHF